LHLSRLPLRWQKRGCRTPSSAPLPIVVGVHYLSTSVQLLGTAVTGYGLLYAYGRAKGLPAQIRQWWARIRRKPRNIAIDAQPMKIRVEMGVPDVYIEFKLDQDAEVGDQLAQLEDYVRELRKMFGQVSAAIARLDKAIERAKTHADDAAAEALADAKAELKRFGDRLDHLQATDLRLAAAGAFIMALGYALSFFGW
jgi:hypothetical protein